MAKRTKTPGSEKKQQSLSLSGDTVKQLEEEAERLGIKKSQLVEQILNNKLSGDDEEEPKGKPMIIAVMSYKGGVGKTTTSISLGVGLGAEGHKVLIIDMDGQGNASQYLGVYDQRSEDACIADVLCKPAPHAERMTLDEVIKETDYENVYIVPSNFRFADADASMKSEGAAGIDSRLCYAIEDMEQTFDYIIIDCGPRLDMTTTNAIVALEAGNNSSLIIIPVKVDGFAIAGVSQTIAMIQRIAKERRKKPRPWRILQTAVESRTGAYKYGLEQLKEAVPGAIFFTTKISKSTVVPESSLINTPLISYDPNSKPAMEYQLLVREIEALNEQ